MKDSRYSRVQTRNGIASGLLVVLVAAIVVVGPHFLRASPTTNESTDQANGVRTTPGAVASPPRCDAPKRSALMNLQGYLDLAAAKVCVISTSPGSPSHTRSFVLSVAQLRQLEADFNAHSTSQPILDRACPRSGASTRVAGITADGQQVMLFGSCTGEFAGIGRYWVPNPVTRATIKALAGHPPQP
jgi:hypothetical protein